MIPGESGNRAVDFASISAVVGTGLGFGGAVLALFWKSEDVASPTAKIAISNWLRRLDVGDSLERWPEAFIHLFDRLFGERHLTLHCFLRSSLASLASVVVLFFVFLSLRGVEGLFAGLFSRDRLEDIVPIFLLFIFGVNLLADYLSLMETRALLRILLRVRGAFVTMAFVLVDIALTLAIYFAVALVSLTLGDAFLFDGESLSMLMRDPAEWFGQFYDVAFELFRFEGFIGKYGICLYSSFFTSLWIWLFVVSRWLVRLAPPLRAGLRLGQWFFDIEAHPLRSLGVVAGGLASLGYWLVLVIARAAEATAA